MCRDEWLVVLVVGKYLDLTVVSVLRLLTAVRWTNRGLELATPPLPLQYLAASNLF